MMARLRSKSALMPASDEFDQGADVFVATDDESRDERSRILP